MNAMPAKIVGLGSLLLLTNALSARTVTLTAEDCDQMAAISALAPRLSWAMVQPNTGVFNTQPQMQWHGKMALLMRFPFTELIPKGQRITKAEMSIAPTYLAGGVPEVHVRRILAEWGTGVCHLYRRTYPEKVEWAQPGGRGAATDRAAKDSAVFKFAKIGEQTVDLTEDVELWYTGAAANRGWIMTLEPDGTHIYLPSPYTLEHLGGGKQWKLQVTFEPQ
jgi:hypothetical protein